MELRFPNNFVICLTNILNQQIDQTIEPKVAYVTFTMSGAVWIWMSFVDKLASKNYLEIVRVHNEFPVVFNIFLNEKNERCKLNH